MKKKDWLFIILAIIALILILFVDTKFPQKKFPNSKTIRGFEGDKVITIKFKEK